MRRNGAATHFRAHDEGVVSSRGRPFPSLSAKRMGGEDVAGLAIVDIYQASRSTTAQSPNSYQVLFQGFFWETGCLHN